MRILDLGCGAGGAAMGLRQAFPDAHIVGVDIESQPDYPFTFIQSDMANVEYIGFDLVWLSAPCQRWSTATPPARRDSWPDLITPMRQRFLWQGIPYVIENVVGAPLRNDLLLCGQMFPQTWRLYRHRVFECSFPVQKLTHPPHLRYRGWGDTDIVMVVGGGLGSYSDIQTWCDVMQMQWVTSKRSLAEAVPPAYAKYIGEQFRTWQESGSSNVELHGSSTD